MDSNFPKILKGVLKHEGGWADNPKDPGGATMKGVTIATFRKYVKPNATKADLKAITDEQVATVYRRNFWDVVHGSEMPSGLDYAMMDYGVNSGPGRAIKELQGILGVTADGRLGPKSMTAVGKGNTEALINKLCDRRLAFMQRIKNKKTGEPLWKTFGKGWSSRVADVRKQSLLMAAQPGTVTVIVDEPKKEPEIITVPKAPEPVSVTPNKRGLASIIAIITAIAGAAYAYFFGG